MKTFAINQTTAFHFICAWLFLLFVLVWWRVSLSEQIPTYDAFEYYYKAKVFWDAVASHRPFNPFNLEPTLRPPGTILMSYPFGFDENPTPFYFRSIVLSIACFVTAIVLVGREVSIHWTLAAALSASSLPVFFQFESGNSPIHFFGLVDCFFAGLSALAAAAVVLSVRRKSNTWTLVASMLAAYSLTVKPTGLAIMALVGTAWLTGAALNVIQSWKASTNSSLGHMIFGLCTFFIVYIFFAVICFNSEYLSNKNIQFGLTGQQILQNDFSGISWRTQSIFLYFSFGVCFPLSVTINIIYASLHSKLRSIVLTEYAWNVGCSVTFLASGCWIWLVSSNGTQFRYFYPFVFASFIFAASSIARAFSLAPRFVRALSIALFLAPLSWTTLFLVIPGDEAEARLVGMVLNAGPASEEDQKAEQFFQYLRKAGKLRSQIYYVSLGGPAQEAFFRRVIFEYMIRRSETTFSMVGPITWTSSSVVRIDNIIGSDFILISKIDGDRRLNLISTKSVGDLYTEVDVFRAWGTLLGQKDGVVEVLSTQSAVIYEIVDRQALKRSLQSLVQGRSWREEFLSANSQKF